MTHSAADTQSETCVFTALAIGQLVDNLPYILPRASLHAVLACSTFSIFLVAVLLMAGPATSRIRRSVAIVACITAIVASVAFVLMATAGTGPVSRRNYATQIACFIVHSVCVAILAAVYLYALIVESALRHILFPHTYDTDALSSYY